jgi:hypothetical protein
MTASTKTKERKSSAKPVKKYQYTKIRGKVSMDRPCSDPVGWAARRKQEKPPPGGFPKPPPHWPKGVRVDVRRPVFWLPKGWGQGIKTTCTARLVAFVSPEGKCYYHRYRVEEVLGRKLGPDDNLGSATEWAKTQIQAGKDWKGQPIKFDGQSKLFAQLSSRERQHLVKPENFHFAVISARRSGDIGGLRGIVRVESQIRASGIQPTWYVDAASADAYRQLGLKVVVGGKLVPARNMALVDAEKLGKVCVQVSDDISRWSYYVGSDEPSLGLFAGNQAAKEADRLRISPVMAAQFILAKMRGSGEGEPQPKLGGVFPLGNVGMSFGRGAIATEHFILGDFFVQDLGSKCRFDPRYSLKEDYDFTCAHLDAHGAVMRCNRMFITAVHETNAGGACSERDESGEKESANIRILQEKWPGVFSLNGRRGDGSTQVTMTWRRRRQ